MYSLHLSAEQLEIRDTVRDFVTQEVKPVVLKADRLDACDRRLPMALLDKTSQLGLRTLALAEDHGGAGADQLTCAIVTEELAVGDADIAATFAETSRLGHLLFGRAMTPAQRDRWLPPFVDNHHCHLAFARHEPGSDVPLGVDYHRPIAAARRQDHGREVPKWRLDRQWRQGLRRQCAGRGTVSGCRQNARAAGRAHPRRAG